MDYYNKLKFPKGFKKSRYNNATRRDLFQVAELTEEQIDSKYDISYNSQIKEREISTFKCWIPDLVICYFNI